MNRQYVIMCGGVYEAFGKPKAMTVVRGEEIVARTIRLLKAVGIPAEDIHISGTDERLAKFGVDVLRHENSFRFDGTELFGCWLDAFYPGFEDGTKVTFLYGDVVYTEGAIRAIVGCRRPGEILFGTGIARNRRRKNWGEPFAYKVDDYRRFMDGVEAVKILWREGKLSRHPITWELYRYLNGLDVNVQRINGATYICIDDGTADVDAPFRVGEVEKKI